MAGASQEKRARSRACSRQSDPDSGRGSCPPRSRRVRPAHLYLLTHDDREHIARAAGGANSVTHAAHGDSFQVCGRGAALWKGCENRRPGHTGPRSRLGSRLVPSCGDGRSGDVQRAAFASEGGPTSSTICRLRASSATSSRYPSAIPPRAKGSAFPAYGNAVGCTRRTGCGAGSARCHGVEGFRLQVVHRATDGARMRGDEIVD